MKKLYSTFLCLLLSTLFYACEDSIPRDRPTISSDIVSEVGTDDSDEADLLDIPERPSGAIIIDSNFCGCKNGEPITIGDCASMCSVSQNTTNENETLYFSTSLTEAITLDAYEDFFGWCNKEITDPNTGDPVSTDVRCYMEVKNESGDIVLNQDFEPVAASNSQSVSIAGIDEDATFRLTFVEASSGARSTTIQIRKESEIDENAMTGPLMLMPISQYTCIVRPTNIFNEETGEIIITDINRFHFYFNSETRPEPLQASTLNTLYCHDIEKYSTPVASPLLEEKTGSYTLWNKNDPRFYSLDGDEILDINQIILSRIQLQGASLNTAPNLFLPISWPNHIDDGDSQSGDSDATTSLTPVTKELGYAMSPFLDGDTFKSYCPTQQHYYNTTNPLFKALRGLIGDTEALYAAKQDNVLDYLLVRQSVVEDIWFYTEAGVNIKPTTESIQGKQIKFYWPPEPSSPYIKKDHQRVYTIKAAGELSGDASVETGATNSTGVRTDYPTHDKRVACIPVLVN